MNDWIDICALNELPANAGLAARVGGRQLALFHLPKTEQKVFALANHDPKGGASVLSRGLLGDIGGELVVASPLYKHHYRLRDGQCLEDEGVRVPTWQVKVEGGRVLAQIAS
ncbi:MAG: nitrite reductase small subunit NirD [Pseudomonadota bacterium]